MKIQFHKLAAGLLATSCLAGPACAQTALAPATPVELPADSAQNPFADAVPAGDDALDAATAREDISQIARSQQSANVSNNRVDGTSTTGAVGLSDNAFQGSTGLTIVNANSGNNVAMNASMNVNIVMSPAAPQ